MIDATGKYVIPGGIDAHTHMEMPFGGTARPTPSRPGTRAAAWGGTTTIVDFAVQYAGENVLDQYHLWHEKAAGNCAIDYGFHQIIGGVDDESLKAMDELVAEGITSFKLFMAYPGVFYSDDGQILQAMQKAADQRLDDHDARRERPARSTCSSSRRSPRATPTPYYHGTHPPVADGGGGHPPRDHARRTSPAPRSTSCT